MCDWKDWEHNFAKGVRKQEGFRKTPMRMIPHHLLHKLKIKEERYRKVEKRCIKGAELQKSRIVYSVSFRRHWVHRLRMKEGQDEVLNDYKKVDPHLTLDWNCLNKEA